MLRKNFLLQQGTLKNYGGQEKWDPIFFGGTGVIERNDEHLLPEDIFWNKPFCAMHTQSWAWVETSNAMLNHWGYHSLPI